MFKTNLKLAWCSMLKDRRFTLLNLLGLATGLACTLLIYIWIADEMSVDKFQVVLVGNAGVVVNLCLSY